MSPDRPDPRLPQPRPVAADRARRADLLVAGVLMVTTLLVALLLVSGPLRFGLWSDDNLYMVTSKALADGQGYRYPQLPGQPWQTKYPILYPLLLALIWRVAPGFPGNVHVIQVVHTVLWGAGSWFAYRLMRQVWEVPRWLAAAGIVLAFLGTSTLPLVGAVMSEPLYYILSLAALWALVRACVPQDAACAPTSVTSGLEGPQLPVVGHGRIIARRIALASLLAGLAYLTRPIGVTLIVGLIVDLLLRRRWRMTVLAALPAAVCVIGWQAWHAQAVARNAQIPVAAAFGYNLGHGRWTDLNVQKLLWVAYHNTSDMALSLTIVLNPLLSETWIDNCLRAGLPSALALYGLMLITAACVVAGAIVLWKQRPKTLHLYMACYIGLLWVWPGSPWRFLLVLLPMLNVLALVGLRTAIQYAAAGTRSAIRAALRNQYAAPAKRDQARSAPLPGARIAAVALILLALIFAVKSVRIHVAVAVSPSWRQYDRALEALAELLGTRTPPDAVICANTGGYLYLRTGRKYVPYLAYDDPMPFMYPPDRRFAMCGRGVTEAQYNAYMSLIFDHLLDYLHQTGATYLVVNAREKQHFEEFRQTVPEHFTQLAVTGPYTVYQVLRPVGLAR